MKRITVSKRIACYLVCAIMALTCFYTTSYAVENGDQDGENTVQSQEVDENGGQVDETTQPDTDVPEAEDPEGDVPEVTEPEADDPVVEEPAVEPAEESTVDMDEVLQLMAENTISGITAKYDKAASSMTISWNAYTGAEVASYVVGFGTDPEALNVVGTTLPGEEALSFNPGTLQNVCYTATVTAYDANGNAIAAGTASNLYFMTKTAPGTPRFTVQTMTKAYDSKTAKLNISKQKVNGYKNKTIIVEPTVKITWKACANAQYYKVYKYTAKSDGRIDLTTKKYVKKVDGTSASSYSYTRTEEVKDTKYKSKNYGKYFYKIAAVYPDGKEKVSSALRVNKDAVSGKTTTTKLYTLTMPKFLNVSGVSQDGRTSGRNSIVTYKFYCKTNTSAKFYKAGSGSAYKRWIPKGVKGWTNGGSGSKFQVNDTKYGTGYVMRHKMTSYDVDYSPYVDWTKSRKEKYVNSGTNKFKGGGKYVIWVSRYTQNINVFKKNSSGKYELVRVCECATGQFRHYTASGEFKINKRIQHRIRSKYHYYYLNCYNGINSLHGPTYWKSNSKPKSLPLAHLGKNGMSNGTLGCVRTWNEDAYYIWTHCPMKTKVVVY